MYIQEFYKSLFLSFSLFCRSPLMAVSLIVAISLIGLSCIFLLYVSFVCLLCIYFHILRSFITYASYFSTQLPDQKKP